MNFFKDFTFIFTFDFALRGFTVLTLGSFTLAFIFSVCGKGFAANTFFFIALIAAFTLLTLYSQR
jgi:hypothetical protein